MKLSTLALSSMAAVASALTYSLGVESSDGSVSGLLTGYHEGAGFSYFAVTGPGNELTWKGNNLVEDVGNGITFAVMYYEPYLAFGAISDPAQLTFENNVLVSNETFWGCNNLNDPYNYSQKLKLIVFGDEKPNDSCVEVKITLVENSSSSSAVSSTSAMSSTSTVSSTSAAASSTLATSTTMSSSTSMAMVTSANGVVKNSAGLVALAGVAAMLI